MPRKAHLVSHFSTSELKKRYQKSRNLTESRRWHLLSKVAQGWTIKNSAVSRKRVRSNVVGLSYGYAQRIVKNYNHQGEAGVQVKPRAKENHTGGKKPLLSEAQLEKLTQALQEKPSDGGIWTGVKVARWIEKETGREKVWNQRGWDYLKKCRHSWQRPRQKHRKGDITQQNKFKQNLP